jgi:hypothetical protein
MLALSKKQSMVLLIVLVSCLIALAASMAVIHATNPMLWHQASTLLPNVINRYN